MRRRVQGRVELDDLASLRFDACESLLLGDWRLGVDVAWRCRVVCVVSCVFVAGCVVYEV